MTPCPIGSHAMITTRDPESMTADERRQEVSRANVWRVPLAFSGKRNEVLIDAASLGLIEGGWCVMSGVRDQTARERLGAEACLNFPEDDAALRPAA